MNWKKINDRVFPWKMFQSRFEQTSPGNYFQLQSKRPIHPAWVFNKNISQTFSQKHLGVILDFKLTFEDHLINVLAKVNKM